MKEWFVNFFIFIIYIILYKLQTCCFPKNHNELSIKDKNFDIKEEKMPETDISKIIIK